MNAAIRPQVDHPEIAANMLRAARRRIEGGQQFICHAIVVPHNFFDRAIACELLGYIHAGLEGKVTLAVWLVAQVPDVWRVVGRPDADRFAFIIREARLAWLDRIIYQLELDGTLP